MNSIPDGHLAASSPAPLDSVTIQQIEEEVLRSLMVVTSLGLFAWYVLANFNVEVGDVIDVSYVLLAAAVFSVAAYLLMRSNRWLGVARVVWLVGLCATIGVAQALFQRPEISYFYSLVPLLAAALSFRWQWGILFRIILPLMTPALTVVALFRWLGAWNDYLGPLIYLNRPDLYPLALGVNQLRVAQSSTGTQANTFAYLMAVSAIIALPILLLFFFAQRTFIEGISLAGIKR